MTYNGPNVLDQGFQYKSQFSKSGLIAQNFAVSFSKADLKMILNLFHTSTSFHNTEK